MSKVIFLNHAGTNSVHVMGMNQEIVLPPGVSEIEMHGISFLQVTIGEDYLNAYPVQFTNSVEVLIGTDGVRILEHTEPMYFFYCGFWLACSVFLICLVVSFLRSVRGARNLVD